MKVFDWLDFNYPDGAFDLWQQSVRDSIGYNALEDDTFEAIVLTEPTPVVNDPESLSTVIKANYAKMFSFRVRILGPRSPHRFLENPCEIDTAITGVTADYIFSLIQNHTEVIITENVDRQKAYDIVRVKLERTADSYNTKKAKEYFGIVQVSEVTRTATFNSQECLTLADMFKGVAPATIGGISAADADIMAAQNVINSFLKNSLPVINNLIGTSFPHAKEGSTIRTTEQGRKMIWRMAQAAGIKTKITEEQAATDPKEVERLRLEVVKTGVKVAPPESTNHNPANSRGWVAIDIQSPGHTKPTYDMLAKIVENYFATTDTTPFGYKLNNVVREAANGTNMCGTKKCGVVHINLVPVAPTVASTGTATTTVASADPTSPGAAGDDPAIGGVVV